MTQSINWAKYRCRSQTTHFRIFESTAEIYTHKRWHSNVHAQQFHHNWQEHKCHHLRNSWLHTSGQSHILKIQMSEYIITAHNLKQKLPVKATTVRYFTVGCRTAVQKKRKKHLLHWPCISAITRPFQTASNCRWIWHSVWNGAACFRFQMSCCCKRSYDPNSHAAECLSHSPKSTATHFNITQCTVSVQVVS